MAAKREHKWLGIILRLASIILCVIGFGVGGTAVNLQNMFSTDDDIGQFWDLLPLVGFAYSIIWSAISLVLRVVHQRYHPGIDVGIDLFAWTSNMAFGLLLVVVLALNQPAYNGSDCLQSYEAVCGDSTGTTLKACEIIEFVVAILNGFVHLIVFILACRDTHRVRKERKFYKATDYDLVNVIPKA